MNQKRDSMVNSRQGPTTLFKRFGRPSPLLKTDGLPVPITSPTTQKSTSLGTITRSNAKEVDTPVKAFLNPNITPRSSARKARVDSASSTPNGTPNGTPSNSRPTSMIYQQERGDVMNAQPVVGFRDRSTPRTARSPSIGSDRQSSVLSFKPECIERKSKSSRNTSPETKPMFFHADDVRPGLASIPSERYFEKGNIVGLNSSGLDRKNTTSQSPEPTSLPILYTKPTSRPRSQVFTGGDSPSTLQQQRAPSPLKDEVLSRKSSLSKASPRQHRRLVSNNTLLHEQEIKLPETYPLGSGSANVSRRSSFSSPGQARISHHKSSSVSAVGTIPARRSSIALSESPLVNSPRLAPSVEPGKLQGFQVSPISAPENPLLQGPGKPVKAQSKLDHMNELAANARRERKVLDLEISNSSLLAINRTLEREMRKQNAELRRFRRLSRTGRLSAAPCSRSASKTLSVWSESEDHINNSDAPSGRSSSLTLEDDENDEENSTVSSSADSSDPLSPLDTARVRAKDFKRLHLDLARHRALLVDSQKLDQSLKRCLSRTEDLLADGRKALEYRVQIDKVDAHGGRVLLPDELEENEVGEQRQGLLSPGISERPEMMWKMGDSFEEQDQNEVTADELVVNEADSVVTDGKTALPDSLKEESQDFEAITQNEWDRIKSDVQTPEEFIGSGGGVQGLKEYLSSLGPSWGV